MAAFKLKERLKGKNVVVQFSGANTSPEENKERLSFAKFGRRLVI